MPVTYAVVNRGRLVIEKWTGIITHNELISHEKEQLEDSSISSGACVLSDCRDAVFETPFNRISEISNHHNRSDNKFYFSKCAVIVKSNKTFTVTRIFTEQIKAFGVNAIVFSSLDVACTWLGISTPETKKVIDNMVL
jgi:hypothetical protein